MAQEDSKLATTLKALTDAAKQPEGARNALALLFPKADAVLETYVPSHQADDSRRIRDRRISKSEFAPVYFRLDAGSISWSRSELQEIIELGPEMGFAAVEERVQPLPEQDGALLRRLFLDFLAAYFSEPDTFTADWFYNLMVVSPAYIKQREQTTDDFFRDEGFLPLNRLLLRALRPSAPEHRYLIVAAKLDKLHDLSVFADFFRSTVGDANPDGAVDGRHSDFFGDRTELLRSYMVDRVRDLARSGGLWDQISPSRLIWFWWGSNYEEEVRAFLSKAMATPETLRKVLNLVIGTVISTSGNYERVSPSYRKLIDFKELTYAAERLVELRLDKQDDVLVRRYTQALKQGEGASF